MAEIGNLSRYFGSVKQVCFKDTDGTVYQDNERVALDNGIPNGYIYLAGEVDFDTQSACVGEQLVTKPLVFVGAYPLGIPEQLFNATISALGFSNIDVQSATIDRQKIGNLEGIEIDKFTNVALVRVSFDITQIEIYDPNCEYIICKC